MQPKKSKLSALANNLRVHRTSYLMMLPYLIFFCVFTILPVIVSVVLSFTDYDMVQAPVFVGLENYFQIFLNDEYFIVSLKNTSAAGSAESRSLPTREPTTGRAP